MVFLASSLLSTVEPDRASAQSSRDEREAAEQAVHLSELEAKGRASSLYHLLHSDSKEITPREAVVGWYETDFFSMDPQPISEILDVRFIRWKWGVTGKRYRNTAEIDYVQPFGSGVNVSYVEDTVRLVEEDGEWRWFFGRSRGFLDEQVERFVDQDSSTQRSRNDDDERSSDSSEGLPGSTRNCTLVELYPGYPGYRGNITGVMPHWGGIGDYECLQNLVDTAPQFDRDREDRANKRAARSIGIHGSIENWTWENWMLIEAERGLPVSCYTCLMLDSASTPLNRTIAPSSNDPRILLGFLGDRSAINRIAIEQVGHQPPDGGYYGDDYVLRATAYVRLGPFANAPEILGAMEELIFEASQPGTGYYSTDQILDLIYSRGGYTLTTKQMHPWDQQGVALFTLGIATRSMLPAMRESLVSNFLAACDSWRLTGYQDSLSDYLREHWDP